MGDLWQSGWDFIVSKFTGWLDGLILFEWWALFVLFVAACLFVGFFLPFKWIRAALGGLIILAGAFLAGGTVMYRDIKPKVKAKQQSVPQFKWPWDA